MRCFWMQHYCCCWLLALPPHTQQPGPCLQAQLRPQGAGDWQPWSRQQGKGELALIRKQPLFGGWDPAPQNLGSWLRGNAPLRSRSCLILPAGHHPTPTPCPHYRESLHFLHEMLLWERTFATHIMECWTEPALSCMAPETSGAPSSHQQTAFIRFPPPRLKVQKLSVHLRKI